MTGYVRLFIQSRLLVNSLKAIPIMQITSPSPLTPFHVSLIIFSGLLGEVDRDSDSAVDWDTVRGEPLDGIVLTGGQ